LKCHGDPEDAPESMLKIYGSANGFNWKLNEVIGTQIVTVPVKPSYDAAWNSVLVFLISGGCILLVLFFSINRLLHYLVTKPLNKLSNISERLSLDQLYTDELELMSIQTTTREMNHLWDSIVRLRRSLYHALRLLDGGHLLQSVEKDNAIKTKKANSKDEK
jgi:protein-histidine pros-kinase